jgi:hypothetical protein
MQKCHILKFEFDTLWTHPFGGGLAPLGDLRSKNYKQDKKFFEFNFR